MGTTQDVSREGPGGGAHHQHRLKVLKQGELKNYPRFVEGYLRWVHELERGREVVQLLVEREEADEAFLYTRKPRTEEPTGTVCECFGGSGVRG